MPLLVGGLIALALFLALYLLIDRTDFGLALQATSEDRDAAMLVGIRPQRMYAVAWGLGTALVAVAGVILANFFSVYPQAGLSFTVLAYAIVALGGFGSILGTLLAALLVGVVQSVTAAYLPPAFKDAFVFGSYILIGLFRPRAVWPLLDGRPWLVARSCIARAGRRVVAAAAHGPALPATTPAGWRTGRAAVAAHPRVVAALLYPIPFERSGQIYYETVGFLVLLNAMLGIGWNIIGGWAGQFDFGPSIFFAIGAYTAALLSIHSAGTPGSRCSARWWSRWCICAALTYPVTRLRGHYFAIATVAMWMIAQPIGATWQFINGSQGLFIPVAAGGSFVHGMLTMEFPGRGKGLGFYYLSLLLFAVTLLRRPRGRALEARLLLPRGARRPGRRRGHRHRQPALQGDRPLPHGRRSSRPAARSTASGRWPSSRSRCSR